MSNTETPVVTDEYFTVKINKKHVKRIATAVAATAVVVGAVLVKRNFNIETDENSVTVELEQD